ncbi:MAG: dephospho-CoA kinase [Elusimicrobiota bacterium]
MIIGVTGNIAAGKTEVCDILRNCFGVHIINADDVGHDILINNKKVKQALINSFGVQILNDIGNISRKKLGEIVFRDSAALEFLNNTVWPYLIYEIDEQLQRAKKIFQTIILEAALILEWNARNRVNVLVTVYADDEIRMRRYIRDTGMDEIEASLRFASQKPQEQKKAEADYCIENNGTLEELKENTVKVWENISAVHNKQV